MSIRVSGYWYFDMFIVLRDLTHNSRTLAAQVVEQTEKSNI